MTQNTAVQLLELSFVAISYNQVLVDGKPQAARGSAFSILRL
ncbi:MULTISPECIES: hypothetical protein [Cyanophyceae]|nr:hypothetical protein [Phormidium sp. FACHB-592]